MNNILFLFREEEDGESSKPRYILICVPVLSLFSRAKCLVHPSRVILSDQDWLKEIPQLVVIHSVIPSLWKIPVVLHWNWWYYTYVSSPMEIFNVHAVIMHVEVQKYQWNCQELLKCSPVQSVAHTQQPDSNKWAQNKSLMCLGHPICHRLLQKLTYKFTGY